MKPFRSLISTAGQRFRRRPLGMHVLLGAVLLLAVTALPSCAGERREAPDRGTPPPAAGSQIIEVATPSSDRHPHAAVRARRVGEGGEAAWIFTPERPTPERAAVVLFLHGYRATDPYHYGGWINHLVRRGNIVIYPLFEESWRDPPEAALANAIAGTRWALDALKRDGVTPDLDRVAFVGHSFGGGLAAQMAAKARDHGLPEPRAVMAVQPGWRGSAEDYPAENLSRVPSSVFLLVVEGDEDQFEESRQGETIFAQTAQIPSERRRLVVLGDDGRTGERLVADHYAPLAPLEAFRLEEETRREQRRRRLVGRIVGVREGEIDALDTEALWPMFDSLKDVAFGGGDIDRAVGAVGSVGLSVTAPAN